MSDDVRIATHAAESGHWYRQDGSQVVEVLKADKSGMTRCTLRHARKLDLARGVTSYLKLIDKPALTIWLCRQAILAALTLPKRDGEGEDAWLSRVETDMNATAKSAAEQGTRIHAAVQQRTGGEPCEPAMEPHVAGALERLSELGGGWTSEHGIAHPEGYGTKLDLVNASCLIDFKSKDGDQAALDALELYDEHEMQLVAGQRAILDGFTPAAGELARVKRSLGIMFVSRTHPGVCSLHWMKKTREDRAWRMFSALLEYGQAKDEHTPFKAKR